MKTLQFIVQVNEPVKKVYKRWTTEEGIKSFMADDCKIELKINGAYEIYFNGVESKGARGSEGMKILSFEENKSLAFTWNQPPSLPSLREHQTMVYLDFKSKGLMNTELTLTHVGFGDSEDWAKACSYFEKAWGEIVLPYLVSASHNGKVDFHNPKHQKYIELITKKTFDF
jgi:uncharacterized protein YndB with AHSA1/START domain